MSRSQDDCGRPLRHVLILLLVLSGLTLVFLLRAGLQTTARAATTFVVINTNDGGAGSLRQAILDANANPGADLIAFTIGTGLQTITPTSSLPDIADPVVIDGTTQPGFAGSPLIELSAISTPSNPNRGVLHITAGNTTLRGLIINHFRDAGISIVTGGSNHIEGCYIGTDATGSAGTGSNANGIAIDSSPNNTIGGTTPGTRNVISGIFNANAISIFGFGGNGNQIQGNYIGTNAAGTSGLGNSGGIFLGTSDNIVGGTIPEARNVISANENGIAVSSGTSGNSILGNYIGTDVSGNFKIGNTNVGIGISSSNNTIGGTTAGARNVVSGNGWGIIIDGGSSNNVVQGNYIGVGADGSTALGNRVAGLSLPNTSNTTVGGVIAGAGNTIAFNGPTAEIGVGAGVEVLQETGHSIRGNSIFSNGRLGIDLGSDGAVTPNDPGDGDSGANNRQNFPLITSVVSNSSQTTIAGTLNSTPNTTFSVDFYSNAACDSTGNGEGARVFALSPIPVTTDANGNANFGVALSIPLPTGRVITATATDPLGNTSEFSPCNSSNAMGSAQFGSASFTVNEDVGFATFTVNRVGGSSGALAVNYTTIDITATAGQDYTATSGTLSFADGETTKTIDVPILDDAVIEPNESLALHLRNPANPDTLGNPSTAVVTIQDHNTLPRLSVGSIDITEGNTGTTNAVFTVSLTATGRTVTVNYSTSGINATSGVDFQPVSGSLTFNPRVTMQTISVPVIGDTLDEAQESFIVRLTNPVNAVVGNAGAGTINDDDPPPSVSISDVSVIEGNSGTTTEFFTVSLSVPSGKTITVSYGTADGSASSASDYMTRFNSVTFEPGQTNTTVPITVNGDIVVEPDENFFVNLTSANDATIVDSQGQGTILNDDGSTPVGTIQLSASTSSGTETPSATTKVDLTVTRTGNTAAAASVTYASQDGTAGERSDYSAAFGTIRFQAGEATKTIPVFIVDDSFFERTETFSVTLSNPVGGVLGGPAAVTVTINSDDIDNGPNPVRDASFNSDFFVRQHYVDFFNREADAPGLAFWKNQIDECTTQACREIRRINVSAAFFVSGEFQQTGYLVYKAYQASFNSGEQLRLQSFLPDTQEIGRGVIFGQPGADQQLETNKQNFFLDFVQRPAFLAPGAYPTTLTAAQFVDKLNGNTFDPLNPGAGALTQSERDALVAQLTPDPTSPALRAQVLRSVSENELFTQRQFNKAFVLMQYFGYLRRNPDATPDTNFDGYNFWLGKLNQFNGNFVDAEMVKAFITSGEYIQRFGP